MIGTGGERYVRVIVVGAGVMGLTCAIRLREAGYDAHVLARDLPPETTSAVAAALWYPYRALPQEKVTRWSKATYDELARLAAQQPAAGVAMRWGTELLHEKEPDPCWRDAVPTIEAAQDLPDGYAGGWRLQVPVADTPTYLGWLVSRLEALGGTLTRAWLPALPNEGLVVNCTGLAARAVAGDDTLRPVRGQVVYVEQVGLTEWLLEQSDAAALTYVVPRESDIVVGGTAEEDAYDPRPDPATEQQILDRARTLVPALGKARPVGRRVGLRPARPTVRLETALHERGAVVHCYGHGGAGVTLSWGCADEVVAKIAEAAAARA
ncbi:MAG: FAD-dependent oxidoreductase [Actinomycetes bacterium]